MNEKNNSINNETYSLKSFLNSLETEKLQNETYLREFLTNVNNYLTRLEISETEILELRTTDKVFTQEINKFFRSKERNQNVKLIIQYLMTFLENLPLKKDIENEPINPFKQFKGFTEFNINVLKEDDVQQAAFRIQRESKKIKNKKIWCDKKTIDKIHSKMLASIKDTESATPSNYLKLFKALNELCIFWFRIRSQNLLKVRASDMYIYKLTSILLSESSRL